MKFSAQQLVIRQIAELESDVRFVFVHPNYVQQHLILPYILDDALYVRFEGKNLNHADLRDQMNAEIQRIVGNVNFAHVNTLILDECDRASKAEFDQFIRSLLHQPDLPRVILLSRYAPPSAIVDENIRKVTRFVPVSESLMLWDYARRSDAGGALLEVRALGEGRVQLNGERVEDWDGLLPRALFFYLVDRGMVTRNEIFETFWPTLSAREATNVFHVTKRKISEVLGADLTVYWSGFYHISPRIHLSYDVAMFSQMIQDSAVMGLEDSIALAQQAIELYRGDFLTSLNMPWAQRRRLDLRQTYGDALIALAKITERSGTREEALGLYLQAAATNRQREDLAQNIMRLYQELGMHDDALLVYRRLEDELKNTLNVAPARYLQDLAALIEGERRSSASA